MHTSSLRCLRSYLAAQLRLCGYVQLDAWSVGALAYDVLVGRPPFALHDNITREAEQKAICQQDPHFPSGLSYSAVSFLKQCLEKDPQKRPSIKQLMHHQWFD